MPALALETIDSALSIDPASVPAMSLAGAIYRQTGRPEEAKALLTRAISKGTSCADCYRNLGEICFDVSDYARAIGYFKRALDIAGDDEQTAVRLARAYKLSCQDEKALELFAKVLAANPNQYEAFYELTNLCIRSGRIEEAKQMVAERKKERKTVWHHLAAGEIYEIAGNTDVALISYAVALHLKHGIPEAHSGLGRVDLLRKDYGSAIENFGRALAGDPYNPYLMLDLARAYEGIGEDGSAFEIYREVSGKYPKVTEAYFRFAQFHNRLQEHMQAICTIEEGLQHNPRSPQLLMELGHAYCMIGRYRNAVSAYNRARRKGGRQYLDAYLYIANTYSKHLNNEKEARKYYRKYLRAGGEKEDMKRQIAVLEQEE
jgi:tetratricopeptide (TPR) repeat protein